MIQFISHFRDFLVLSIHYSFFNIILLLFFSFFIKFWFFLEESYSPMICLLSHSSWNLFLIFSVSVHYISKSLINFILLFFLNIFLNILIRFMFTFDVSTCQSHEHSVSFSVKSYVFWIIFLVQFSFYNFSKFIDCVKISLVVSLVDFSCVEYF
jgi:hypothetical protein